MSELFDETVLEQLKGFIQDKFPEVVEVYLRSAGKYVGAINEGLAGQDAQKIVDAAHPLKSSSGNLGLVGLFKLCEALEKAASEVVSGEKDFAVLPVMAEPLPQTFEESVAFLKAQIA